MSSQSAARIAWPLSALSVGLVTCGLVLAILNGADVWEFAYLTAAVSSALVGGVVASHRPAHPVGWLFVASAASFSLAFATAQYATYGLVTRPGSLPWATAMAWPHTFLIVLAIAAVLAFLPLYFPDGRLISPRWRPAVWLAALFCVFASVSSAFRPGEVQEIPGVANPLGIEALQPALRVLDSIFLPLWPMVIMVSAAGLAVRFRRSRGEERQRMKWLTYAIVSWAVMLLLTFPAEAVDRTLFLVIDLGLALAFAGIPLAAGIAILRHNLYDIDLIINRTLVYTALTGSIAGIYVLVVGGLGALLEIEGNLLVSLFATALVAVAVAPLRDRLQWGVNRVMYGERDEPYRVLSALGQRLEQTLAADAVLPTIVQAVKDALKLPYAAIETRDGQACVVAASTGQPVRDLLRLPLMYQGGKIGELVLGPRTGERAFTPADRQLLGHLARQAGVAIHAAHLAADLRRSNERLQAAREGLVTAREEERRRLRRDLHDGLGPALASESLKVGAIYKLMDRDRAAAEVLLRELGGDIEATIADIRRLVYDLRPPALDELGLVGAIRERVAQLHSELQVVVDAPEQLPALPAAVEVAAYRIAQEALTNVARHAHAACCMIHLGIEKGVLCMEVADNGVGLATERKMGVGMLSMRERAEELGGTWTAETLRTGGTQILVRVPLQKE